MGQLFSVFALKYVSHHGSVDELKAIAEIDSLILFMINAIALGLQSAAIRDLALEKDWKKNYYDIQSARLTLGLLIACFAFLAFFNTYYIVFLIAPLLGWSGDYALYARSHPITGSIVAFVRLLVPFSLLIFFSTYKPELLAVVYIISVSAIYLITNLYISNHLKTAFFFIPKFKNLHLYLKSMSLGVVVVSLYFIGLGLVLLLPYFYKNEIVAVAFVGLKFYIIFKGLLRIIHQAFVKEMISDEVCLKIDQMGSLLGLIFFAAVTFFPNTVISLFFGEKYLPDKLFFILLSIGGLIYSAFSSFIIRLLLEKKDKAYALISSIAALITIVAAIITSYFWQTASAVGGSLIIGELAFSAGMIFLMNRPDLIRKRLLFLASNMLFVIVPVAIGYFWGDKMISFIIAISLFVSFIVLIHYRKFVSSIN